MGLDARALRKVYGREEQLARIAANLQRVTDDRQSRVLLMKAVPGGGKTRLLVEAATVAIGMGFAVVDGVAARPAAAPAGAQAPGGTRAAARDPVPGQRRSAVVEDVGARLRRIAEHVPVLVTLDDVHLSEFATLTASCDEILALKSRPILWLLAFTAEPRAAPSESVRTCLSKLRGRVAVEPMPTLGPLTGDALADLVADFAGAPPDAALLVLVDSVNVTPGVVIELVRGLVEDGDVRVVEGTSRLARHTAGGTLAEPGIGIPAPVPQRVSLLIENSLRWLSEPTVKTLRLAAVLGSPFAPEDLSALLNESPAGLLPAVDEAVDRGVLICGEHSLAFRTDPIWRVLLDSVPAPVCALLRRQAAELMLRRAGGVERAALQLAQVARPGDARELDVIAEGARRLVAADPSTAASLATRGMELLRPGQAGRVRLASTAVKALTRAGDLDGAVALARGAIDEVTGSADLPVAALAADIDALRASMSTALLLRGDAEAAARAADDALARREDAPREAVVVHLAASHLSGDSTVIERAWEILSAPECHELAVLVGAMTVYALDRWGRGQVGGAVDTLRDAVALSHAVEDTHVLDPRWFLALSLARTGADEEAEAVVQGYPPTTAGTVEAALRARLHLVAGRLDEADAAAQAVVAADGWHLPILAPQAWLVLAHVALRRGALPRAEHCLRAGERDCAQLGSAPWLAAFLLLKAQVAEAQAGPAAAVDMLARTGMRAGTLRLVLLEDPAAAAWWVRCALAADRPDVARAVVDTAEHLGMCNPQLSTVLGAAAHARALLDRDADAVARAGRLHRNPWAQAAAAEDLAELLADRGEHETAIAELDRAMSAYCTLGAEWDATRVRARLRELGVLRRHWKRAKRPVSGWDSLTQTERKVAEMVASGLTNQQTARHLFISPNTVGTHLRQVYRKLGIRSRSALVRLTTSRELRPEAVAN